MKTVTVTIQKTYDFSESLELLNDQRAQDGEPPMTDEEITEWAREEAISAVSSDPFRTEDAKVTIEED